MAGAGRGYAAGACNIGSGEIPRRRWVGHAGLVATVGLLVVLVASDADPIWRMLVALPAAAAAIGYLQAALRFCVHFGLRGVFNFGDPGSLRRVEDPEDRASDRRRALLIGLGAAGIGLAIGAMAVAA